MQSTSPWVTTYLPLFSTLVVAAATVVLACLTSHYVRLTARMVEEAQKSREPAVTLDFEIPDHSLRLVVENHGSSPARNVRIAVLKDVPWLQMRKDRQGLSQCSPVREGVSYLTPARKLKYYLGFPNWKDTPDEQMEATLRITYENEAGKSYEHTVTFDFGQMREVLVESFTDSNLAVAEAIRESERSRQSTERTRQLFSQFGRPKTKKCSMCAETIPEEAKKCSHCHELQNTPGPTTA